MSENLGANMSTKLRGTLEIDSERGVIYFHSAHSGTSRLRIQGLPKPIPRHHGLLDINFGARICNWHDKDDVDSPSNQ